MGLGLMGVIRSFSDMTIKFYKNFPYKLEEHYSLGYVSSKYPGFTADFSSRKTLKEMSNLGLSQKAKRALCYKV